MMSLVPDFRVTNTLRLDSHADFGGVAATVEDVLELQAEADRRRLALLPLGQGSNVIPMPRLHRLVCHMAIRGIEIVEDRGNEVLLQVGAGEDWDGLVRWCIEQQFFGIENLSLIPGSVGAAPVQNIGAYGVEIGSFIEWVEVAERGTLNRYDRSACRFAYRSSVFQHKDGIAITAVALRLSRAAHPVLTHREVAAALRDQGITTPTPQEVAHAIIRIRSNKLPDPNDHPNAGSFFKNPYVAAEDLPRLKALVPDLVHFPDAKGVKLSAAQLIDRAGWKNKPARGLVCWHKQPLVVVNQQAGDAREVLAFASAIRDDIQRRYGVALDLEPTVLR